MRFVIYINKDDTPYSLDADSMSGVLDRVIKLFNLRETWEITVIRTLDMEACVP